VQWFITRMEIRATDLADLGDKLPVRVKDAVSRDLESCPGFINLLDKLSEKLEPTGRSSWTHRKVKAEEEKTEAARKKFLEKAAKVEALQEVVLKHELSNLKASHETAVVGRLSEALTLAEVGGLLELGEVDGETVTTLSLDPSDPRLAPRLEEDFPREVVALVEEEIQSRLLPLLHLLLPSSHQLNRRQAHPHLLRLGDMVRELQESVEIQEKEEKKALKEVEQGREARQQLITQVVAHLETLVKKHCLGCTAEHTSTTVNYLKAKTEALALKLRCLELEVLNATYTKDSVAALRKVRERLCLRLEEREQELFNLRSSLKQYQAAGPDFAPIVVEFARLQKEIEGKRWALAELGGAAPPAL